MSDASADPNEFVEVYATATGRKQRVPRAWLGDPVLGRGIRLTPSQRELDGALPPRPTEDSTVAEIEEYADQARIHLRSSDSKTEKLTAVEAVFAHADEQAGVVPVDPDPPVADPLAPQTVALVDSTPPPHAPDATSVDDPDLDTDTGDAGQEN